LGILVADSGEVSRVLPEGGIGGLMFNASRIGEGRQKRDLPPPFWKNGGETGGKHVCEWRNLLYFAFYPAKI